MKRTKYLFLSAILVLAVGCSPKKAGTIGADASVESRVEARDDHVDVIVTIPQAGAGGSSAGKG